ncbi:MAG: CCA tRNA nucleotidyltransferase [Desulfurococcales archaeon]|nr:CCA tRNA nucleotidyltransferase [Desulfurococcales archaeon]
MPELATVLEEVKKEVRPSEEELRDALTFYEELKEHISESLRISSPYRIELEGSLAKGTALKGDLDLDVFVLIRDEDLSREVLIQNFIKPLELELSKHYLVRRRFASHPYLRVRKGSLEADVVPAYWAKDLSEIRTAVDRTPFHTRYVVNHLTESMKDEVRLLKKFFKGIGVYGAEIRTQGFSGYLTELLIIKYGSFTEALKAMKGWGEGTVVVVENCGEDLATLRQFFRDDVLIVPDPVDTRRNTAAAVSKKSLTLAILAASAFLKEPDKKFFSPPRRALSLEHLREELRTWGRELVIVLYKMKEPVPDVTWGELRRVCSRVLRSLEVSDYPVVDCGTWSDEENFAMIAFDVVNHEKIPPFRIMSGPKKVVGEHLVRFVEKHLRSYEVGPWVDFEGRLKALKPRSILNVEEYLRSNSHVLSCGSGEVVLITSNLAELLRYLEGRGVDKDAVLQWLTAVVAKRLPWL